MKFDKDDLNQVPRRQFFEVTGGLSVSALLASAGQAFPQNKDSSQKIRMGVVGGGFGSSFQWQEHPHCVVTGVTDLRPDRRDRLRQTYHCDAVYDSLEIMIEKAQDIDAVAVFSGALDHVKHTRMCMERGWHVISAVPACFTLEEAQQLKEITKRTGLRYMMAETGYYRQECILMRELFKKGALGNLFYTECEYYHDRGDLDALVTNKHTRFYEPDGSRSWRWGYPPMHYPTHSLAYVTGVTGERSQWFGDKSTFYMAKGGVHGSKFKFRTKGETSSRYGLPEQEGGDIRIPEYWKSNMLPKAMQHRSGHGGSHTFISAEFVNALLEEREPAINVDDALAMTVPGIVAQQSALKNGEQLVVPQFA